MDNIKFVTIDNLLVVAIFEVEKDERIVSEPNSVGEVERYLGREPGTPTFGARPEVAIALEQLYAGIEEAPQFARLKEMFTLSRFEMATLLLALSPELDAKYERLYGYLLDDLNLRRPSVDLALNLFCATAEERNRHRADFYADSPLLRYGLLALTPPYPDATLIAHNLIITHPVIRFLMGHYGLDAALLDACRLEDPIFFVPELLVRYVYELSVRALCDDDGPYRGVYLQGPQDSVLDGLIAAVGHRLNRPTLRVDLTLAPLVGEEWSRFLHTLLLEATLHGALLVLTGWDTLVRNEHSAARRGLLGLLNRWPHLPFVATGTGEWKHDPLDTQIPLLVNLPRPDVPARRRQWEEALAAMGDGGAIVTTEDLDALAARHPLTAGQIARATRAVEQEVWKADVTVAETDAPQSTQMTLRERLFRAARAQTAIDLGPLASRIEPRQRTNTLVLPDDSEAQLRSICDWVRHRERVLHQWGFESKLPYGKGVSALFYGPSGTGKTMAAAIIAAELGLDLYKIDLSGVVSKYIGETEKNLSTLFEAATQANAILFFDEADALFGKRSEVKDAHDRHANIEVAYLLQRMEQYEGVTILASNLRQDMDEAFTRRLAFIVPFPFPDEASRLRIWQGIWPAETPLMPDIDWEFMAREFRLSGGNIKNIALGAAFLAATADSPVGMAQLLEATRREFLKMGKTPPEATCFKT